MSDNYSNTYQIFRVYGMIMCATPNYIQKDIAIITLKTQSVGYCSFPLSQEHSEGEAVAASAIAGMTVLRLHSHNLPKEWSKPRYFHNADTGI